MTATDRATAKEADHVENKRLGAIEREEKSLCLATVQLADPSTPGSCIVLPRRAQCYPCGKSQLEYSGVYNIILNVGSGLSLKVCEISVFYGRDSLKIVYICVR